MATDTLPDLATVRREDTIPDSRVNNPGEHRPGDYVNATGGAVVPLLNPPGTTSANVDIGFYFAAVAGHVLIQNNSASAINVDTDQVASPGSILLAASGGVLVVDAEVREVHIYATAVVPVNGIVGSNIVIRGWR